MENAPSPATKMPKQRPTQPVFRQVRVPKEVLEKVSGQGAEKRVCCYFLLSKCCYGANCWLKHPDGASLSTPAFQPTSTTPANQRNCRYYQRGRCEYAPSSLVVSTVSLVGRSSRCGLKGRSRKRSAIGMFQPAVRAMTTFAKQEVAAHSFFSPLAADLLQNLRGSSDLTEKLAALDVASISRWLGKEHSPLEVFQNSFSRPFGAWS